MSSFRDLDFLVENATAYAPRILSPDEENFRERNQFDDRRIAAQLSTDKDVRRAFAEERNWTLNR